jgi:acetyl-CoA carboxylase carboxyltransferase component
MAGAGLGWAIKVQVNNIYRPSLWDTLYIIYKHCMYLTGSGVYKRVQGKVVSPKDLLAAHPHEERWGQLQVLAQEQR